MNLLYFGCVFVVILLAQFLFVPPLFSGWSPDVPKILLEGGWVFMIFGIFVFNFVLSAFVVVTLPGVVFFPLSAGFLLFRAVLWGLLLYGLPNWLFLAVLPLMVLEGEAYVFAGVAGTAVGVSWVKPKFLYREESLSRFGAFKKALRDCLRLYFFVTVFLFVAAIVETVTIILMGHI
jgi:hypothetical protein